jgi:hypothetical protein
VRLLCFHTAIVIQALVGFAKGGGGLARKLIFLHCFLTRLGDVESTIAA